MTWTNRFHVLGSKHTIGPEGNLEDNLITVRFDDATNLALLEILLVGT